MKKIKMPVPARFLLPVEENEFILYATRYSIHRYDLSSGISEELPLTGLRGAVALDFDYDRNCLYWADVTLDIIQVNYCPSGLLRCGKVFLCPDSWRRRRPPIPRPPPFAEDKKMEETVLEMFKGWQMKGA